MGEVLPPIPHWFDHSHQIKKQVSYYQLFNILVELRGIEPLIPRLQAGKGRKNNPWFVTWFPILRVESKD